MNEAPRRIIVDIDGTICDATHRMHHIEHEPKNWDAWYAAVIHDAPIEPILNLVDALSGAYIIDLVTGRSDIARRETENWLTKHRVPYDRLLMRKEGDHRPDTIVKTEIYREHFTPGSVWFVLEDRNRVARMWRDLGLTCLQVSDGDY